MQKRIPGLPKSAVANSRRGGFAILLWLGSAAVGLGEPVDFGGQVTDASGRGIANATVTVNAAGLSALSGPDGSFRISGDAVAGLRLDRGILSLGQADGGPFSVAMYTFQGRKVGGFSGRNGNEAFDIRSLIAREPAAGYLIRYSIGSSVGAARLVPFPAPHLESMPTRASPSKGLAKGAANAPFVLTASAPGFVSQDLALAQPTAQGLVLVLADVGQGARLGAASAAFVGDSLVVSTGKVRRVWKWTGKGFATVSLSNMITGRNWVRGVPSHACDWGFVGVMGDATQADNVGVGIRSVIGAPLQSDHLEISAEVDYPAAQVSVRYVIWAYPDAPGLRTQVFAKATNAAGADNGLPANSGGKDRIEFLSVAWLGSARVRAVGHRYASPAKNLPGLDMVVEDTASGPAAYKAYDKSNILWIEAAGEGLGLVKEANKTVDNDGLGTGAFILDSTGLASTGWGMAPTDIRSDRYRAAWAEWSLAYTGGRDEQEMAMKVFDRLRFPVDFARDEYIMENTWGSRRNQGSDTSNVLQDLDACKDLGIDVLQIDAGGILTPTIMALSQADGITLGNWNPWNTSGTDLVSNFNLGNRYLKMDLMHLANYDDLQSVLGAADSLARLSGYAARQNWDITEDTSRVGFFFAREYGNLFLSNRYVKGDPTNGRAVYDPAIMLRDAWQLSRYINLNKILIPIQNVDGYDPKYKVTVKYPQAYCTAIALMGSPLYFQETHLLLPAARDQIRPLLSVYKQNRDAIFHQHVFPIGTKPDGASWPGFQTYGPGDTKQGYLLIFREAGNKETSKSIKLRFLAGKTLLIENLQATSSGPGTRTVKVGADGAVTFYMSAPMSFQFLKYTVQ